MDIQAINQLHRDAMEYSGDAFAAKRNGNNAEFLRLSRKAYELEAQAAHAIAETDTEPTRSVLLRSAATLALDCGEIREAEKLIAIALTGEPPQAIARELRELLLQIVPQLV